MSKVLILTKRDSQDRVMRIYQVEKNGKFQLEMEDSTGKKEFYDYDPTILAQVLTGGQAPATSNTGGGGVNTGGNISTNNALANLPEEDKKALQELIQKQKETPLSEKIKVRYFSGKGEKKPTAIPNQANLTGTFTNSTNYQYAGKKVTAVGFITHTPGEIELRLCEQVQPLTFEVAAKIELKEGEGMQWYPVNIDVPEGKWLAVKCNVGIFKYASATTTDIGGNGFLTITAGMTNPITAGGSSSYLGFGVEVEETIDKTKPYAGKLFSVIGDSISTFEGYITPGNSVFYNAERQRSLDVPTVDHTWWKRTIDELGGLLNTNDSWSGSRVSGDGQGLAFLRTNRIDANTDVCMIMIGINDLSGNVPLGNIGEVGASHNRAEITGAYQEAIEKMQAYYPNMEIVLISNLNRWISGNVNTNASGLTPNLLQNRIAEIAKLYGLKFVSMNEIGHNKFSHLSLAPDNTHPNKLGMERMAKKIVAELS